MRYLPELSKTMRKYRSCRSSIGCVSGGIGISRGRESVSAQSNCGCGNGAAPGQTWLALDDVAWNFDEGCRQAVILDLVRKPLATESAKLRAALLDPHAVAPISDPAFAWWR